MTERERLIYKINEATDKEIKELIVLFKKYEIKQDSKYGGT